MSKGHNLPRFQLPDYQAKQVSNRPEELESAVVHPPNQVVWVLWRPKRLSKISRHRLLKERLAHPNSKSSKARPLIKLQQLLKKHSLLHLNLTSKSNQSLPHLDLKQHSQPLSPHQFKTIAEMWKFSAGLDPWTSVSSAPLVTKSAVRSPMTRRSPFQVSMLKQELLSLFLMPMMESSICLAPRRISMIRP